MQYSGYYRAKKLRPGVEDGPQQQPARAAARRRQTANKRHAGCNGSWSGSAGALAAEVAVLEQHARVVLLTFDLSLNPKNPHSIGT